GVETVVLEGESFPRFHVGESLLPHTVPMLDELGVHEKTKALPHTRFKEGATFVTHDGSKTCVYWFERALPPALPFAYQVRRDEFDQMLLEHSAENGAEVLSGFRAEEPIWDGGRIVGLVARAPDGSEVRFRSRVFLDASGQHAFMARKMKSRI